ncbi:hypothetical protein Y032_0056g2711 [Ancylostoma ceylanicum]|uniref:Sulfotransferase domain-containing protein n=1 Tax=Ancylostoma ceylanicum TaxID=53326 RepID=A0A016U5C6_9BILA|nr:hypothetical protein Y032_0056g2711 [Ancylostoma ceylanicum]
MCSQLFSATIVIVIISYFCYCVYNTETHEYKECAISEYRDIKQPSSIDGNRLISEKINGSDLLPPFVRFREFFLVAPKYNLATCIIEKVMSTFRNAMFCYLNRKFLFEKHVHGLNNVSWEHELCNYKRNYRKSSLKDALISLGSQPVIFAVIRNPLDRFLSGFVDKCMIEQRPNKCFGCERDLKCFLVELKELLFSYQADPNNKTLSDDDIYYMHHFAPMSWYIYKQPSWTSEV